MGGGAPATADGSTRKSAPTACRAWSTWERCQVLAYVVAKTPIATASTKRSTEREYARGRRASCQKPSAETAPRDPGIEPLDERRRERHRPQREEGAREQQDGGRGDEERVDPEASLVRDERPVVPAQLPVAEEREPRDQEVEVRALGEPREGGPAPLPGDRDAPRPQRGEREPEDADDARCRREQV